MKLSSLTIALAAALAITGAASAQQITGAGASFPAPLYAKWGEGARTAIGVQLNDQSIGSGGGINQITNRTVDFGASDAPVAPEKLQVAKLVQFPTVMGAIVLAVNLPDLPDKTLRLTGPVVAEMYLGTIERWNDEKIAARRICP